MVFKNLLNYTNQFIQLLIKKTREIYLNSHTYNKRISSTNNNNLEYKPSTNLLDCLIKFKKKKLILKITH